VKKPDNQTTDRFPKLNRKNQENTTDQSQAKPSSSSEKKYLEEGIQKLERREFKEAIMCFEKVLQADPENIVAYEKITIARSIQADLDSIEEYMAVGKECMKHQDWYGAAEEFQAVLAIQSDHKEARKLLSQISQSADGIDIPPEQPAQDITTMEISAKALEKNENIESEFGDESQGEELFVESLGSSMVESREPEELETVELAQQEQIQYDDLTQQIEKAVELYENGQHKKAKQILLKLDQEHPNHSQIAYYLQILDKKVENGASSRNQETTERLFKEGMDKLDQNDISAAATAFENVLKLKPDFNQAKLMLEKVRALQPDRKASSATTERKTTAARSYNYSTPKASGRDFPYAKIAIIILSILVVAGLGYFWGVKYPEIKALKHMRMAEAFFADKENDRALQEIIQVQKLDPELTKAWELAGMIDLELGKSSEAVDSFKKAVELEPQNTSLVLKLGDAYYAAKQYVESEKQYEKATFDESYRVEGMYKIGLSQSKSGKRENAIETLQKAIELNPDYALAHLELGKLLSADQDSSLAEAEFLIALEKDPLLLDGYRELGDFYLKINQPQKSIEILNKPMTWLKPSNPEQTRIVEELRRLLGKTYFEINDFENAKIQFNKILEIREDPLIFIELGKVYYKMKRDKQAIMAWENALALDTKNADINFYLGTIYLRLNDYKKASEQFQEAIAKDPNHAKAYANQGFVFYRQYKYSQALAAWKRSLAIDPNQPNIAAKITELENKGQAN
jgi:tetratricopeptide (TPR) repeat protein